MATMDMSLSAPMKERVETQARTGRHSDAGDDARDLIRPDRERTNGTAQMQRLVTDGLESGVGERSRPEVLEASRRQAQASSNQRRTKRRIDATWTSSTSMVTALPVFRVDQAERYRRLDRDVRPVGEQSPYGA